MPFPATGTHLSDEPTKLFNAATQTMQALTKYRAKGQQTVQVIHVHNEGQAIVAQNLSSGGGAGT